MTHLDTAQLYIPNACLDFWDSTKIALIEVNGAPVEPSLLFIPDPNYNTPIVALGGRNGRHYTLASSLTRQDFDVFIGPLRDEDGAVKIRVKMSFLHQFKVNYFKSISYGRNYFSLDKVVSPIKPQSLCLQSK